MGETLGPGVLRAFADEHVIYEIEMVSALAAELVRVRNHDEEVGRWDLDWLSLPTRNAQLEAFAVHARNLLDFLYPPEKPKHEDDCFANHYAPGWKPPALTSQLSDFRRRTNKEIAHLTYERVSVIESGRDWDYGGIWHDLAIVLRKLLDQIPAGVVSAAFFARASEAQPAHLGGDSPPPAGPPPSSGGATIPTSPTILPPSPGTATRWPPPQQR